MVEASFFFYDRKGGLLMRTGIRSGVSAGLCAVMGLDMLQQLVSVRVTGLDVLHQLVSINMQSV